MSPKQAIAHEKSDPVHQEIKFRGEAWLPSTNVDSWTLPTKEDQSALTVDMLKDLEYRKRVDELPIV